MALTDFKGSRKWASSAARSARLLHPDDDDAGRRALADGKRIDTTGGRGAARDCKHLRNPAL